MVYRKDSGNYFYSIYEYMLNLSSKLYDDKLSNDC